MIWGEDMSAVGNTPEAGYYVIPLIRPLNSSLEVNWPLPRLAAETTMQVWASFESNTAYKGPSHSRNGSTQSVKCKI